MSFPQYVPSFISLDNKLITKQMVGSELKTRQADKAACRHPDPNALEGLG